MRLDMFDACKMPEGMKAYLRAYGYNFSKKMCDWAVSMMYKKGPGGEEMKVPPYTRESLDALLAQHGIQLTKNNGYNDVYVANMAKNDFFGSGVPGEAYLAKFVKDYIDDVDAPQGHVFCRFYSDCICGAKAIIWEDML